jgi:hypothetical protein
MSEPAARLEDLTISADERAVVHCLLSRLVGVSREQQLRGPTSICRLLLVYAATPVSHRGIEAPPLLSDVTLRPVSGGPTVMRRLGIDRAVLDEAWLVAEATAGVHATLPIEWIEAMFEPVFWPVVAGMLRDGPVIANLRLRHTLVRWSRRQVPATRSRPAGQIARASIATLEDVGRRLMRRACELREEGHDAELLHRWTGIPRRRPVTEGRTEVLRPAPTLQQVRVAWQWHEQRVLAAARGVPRQQLADWIRYAPPSRVRDLGVTRFRAWILLTLFAIVGGRAAAMLRLRRGDYIRAHALRDGGTGPILMLRPGKDRDAVVQRPKPLPEGAAQLLDAWLAFVCRRHGLHDVPADWPLVHGGRGPQHPISYASVRGMFSGKPSTRHRKARRLAIVPHDPTVLGRPPSALSDQELLGFPPHAFRRFADQTARVAARDWVGVHGGPADADDIAEVLLDHRVLKDPYGYAGISSEEGRERYAGVAIAGIWRLITTDDGARKTIDEPALRAAVRLRRSIETELAEMRAGIDRSYEELMSAPLAHARRARDVDVLVDVVTRQMHAARLVERERRLREALTEVNADIAALRSDPSRLVVVRDDAPADAASVDPDLIELEEDGSRYVGGRRTLRCRNALTPAELASVLDVSVATVKRWLRGEGLRPNDPMRPWPPDDIPVQNVSERRRYILVDRINPLLLTEERRLRIEALLATDPIAARQAAESR